MKNDARVGALASWSEQSRYYVCFVNETLNNSGEPLTGGLPAQLCSVWVSEAPAVTSG